MDFACEDSFVRAGKRFKEHYGFSLCSSTIRNICIKHAKAMTKKLADRKATMNLPAQGAKTVIAEADGTMLPMVDTEASEENAHTDGRKRRKIFWKEVRLLAAQEHGKDNARYEVSSKDVEEAGEKWAYAAYKAGWAENSHIHIVGDGANWICNQAMKQFGSQGKFLLDFYHLSEYLGEASKTCAKTNPIGWLKKQQDLLLDGEVDKVLTELQQHLEQEDKKDQDAPVRCAYRYIKNRLDALDYPGTLAQELPIGSGMIEGGHRHVLHRRLKKPGAAWSESIVSFMAEACVVRANGKWENYWAELAV